MARPKIVLFYLTEHLEWLFNVHQSVLNLQAETYSTFLSLHVWMLHGKFSMLKKIGTFPIACYQQIPCTEFRTIDWTDHLEWLKNFHSKATGDFGLGNYDSRQIDLIKQYCDQNNIPYLTMCFHYTEKEFPAIVRHVAECQIHRVDNILPWNFLKWRDVLWKFLPLNHRLKKYIDYYSTVIPRAVLPRDTDVKVDFAKLLDSNAMEQYTLDLGFPAYADNARKYYEEWRALNLDFYQ